MHAVHEHPTREQATAAAAARLAALAGHLHARGHAPDAVATCLIGQIAHRLAATPLSLADAPELPLSATDRRRLDAALDLAWTEVEPAILGTLFERALDPAHRSQLGAHYTDPRSIARILEPALVTPLRAELHALTDRLRRAPIDDHAHQQVRTFLAGLASVRILDPACGSGNFLYLALQALKDLEHAAIHDLAALLRAPPEPARVGPHQLLGIERSPRAAELARITVAIGELQWSRAHGLPPGPSSSPHIEVRDAILDRTPHLRLASRPATWPAADLIVGNPPFLGGKKLRAELGDDYVDSLFLAWQGRVPREADLVAYWHEQARASIAAGRCRRAVLLATQAIRGGANLDVLRAIKSSGDIFLAWRDEPWFVDGAAVRVSLVGQDDGSERHRLLDDIPVEVIHADLSGGPRNTLDLTRARPLPENHGVAFMGDTKGGRFELRPEQAATLLQDPDNRRVVVPWVNGHDVTRRPRGMHIIDFGVDTPKAEAARHRAAFAHIRREVAPLRATNKRASYRDRWWLHAEPRPRLRAAIAPLPRFIATPTAAKHRLFVWLAAPTLPDHQLIIIARSDAYTFGVLHSRLHELWSLRMCSWLGVGNDPRYTPTTTFETFPFPWPLNLRDLDEPQQHHHDAIAAAAEALDRDRRDWLAGSELRTLTRLYNERPAWLTTAHIRLDHAVLAAYGLGPASSDDQLLAALLAENQRRAT